MSPSDHPDRHYSKSLSYENILHIISSARGDQPYSKGLSSAIVDRLIQQGNINTVTVRDLVKNPSPYADEMSYKQPELYDEQSRQLLSYANMIVDEMREANIIVIGTPMFNLGDFNSAESLAGSVDPDRNYLYF